MSEEITVREKTLREMITPEMYELIKEHRARTPKGRRLAEIVTDEIVDYLIELNKEMTLNQIADHIEPVFWTMSAGPVRDLIRKRKDQMEAQMEAEKPAARPKVGPPPEKIVEEIKARNEARQTIKEQIQARAQAAVDAKPAAVAELDRLLGLGKLIGELKRLGVEVTIDIRLSGNGHGGAA